MRSLDFIEFHPESRPDGRFGAQISPKRASEPSPTDRNSLEKRVLESIRTAQRISFEPSKRCRRVLRCAVSFPESRFENVLEDRV